MGLSRGTEGDLKRPAKLCGDRVRGRPGGSACPAARRNTAGAGRPAAARAGRSRAARGAHPSPCRSPSPAAAPPSRSLPGVRRHRRPAAVAGRAVTRA